MDFDNIKQFVKKGEYHYSGHAKDMIFERSIPEIHIVKTVLEGEILETYADDMRGRSYLVLGKGPLHVVVGYNQYREKAIIVTVYIPELPRWVTPRKRGRER